MENPQSEPLQAFHDEAIRLLDETLAASPKLRGLEMGKEEVVKAIPVNFYTNGRNPENNAILTKPDLLPGWGENDHGAIEEYWVFRKKPEGRTYQSFVVELKNGGRILFFNSWGNRALLNPIFGVAKSLKKYAITELEPIMGGGEHAGYSNLKYWTELNRLLNDLRQLRAKHDPKFAGYLKRLRDWEARQNIDSWHERDSD